jgi:hypothetical protein
MGSQGDGQGLHAEYDLQVSLLIPLESLRRSFESRLSFVQHDVTQVEHELPNIL